MSVTIVLLAAGASSRMRGADKLLEEVDGRPLLRLVAERCIRAAPTRVVLGPGQHARRATLDGCDVEIVEAQGTDGMAASIRAGLTGLRADGAMIMLADLPGITAADLHLIISLWSQGLSPIVQAATADGVPGSPVLIGQRHFKEFLALRGDTGGREILRRHAADVALVPLEDDRPRIDLDTPEDWAAWRAGQDS